MPDSLTRTYATRHGPMIGLRNDVYVSRSLELYGEYCPDELVMLAQMVRPGMTVVEIGANIGTHTVPLARACSPGPLFAFEPQQRVFQVLCANLVLNDVHNVVARPEAVGAAAGTVMVPPLNYGAPGNFGGLALDAGAKVGLPTPLIALDGLGLPNCGLLKVDVEGFEPAVLRGAAQTIARCRPFIYVENDRAANQQENISLIAAMGYRLFWHTPLLYSPANFNKAADNVFGALASLNMLCIPAEKNIQVENLGEIDPQNWTSPIALRTGSGA